MTISKETINNILSSTDIVSIISQYVELKRCGKNYQGCCPFHKEDTPSFTVNPTSNLYYCFGCKKGGNVINFLKEINGQSFTEVIEKLAEESNISLEYENSNRHNRDSGSLMVLKTAHDYYCEQFSSINTIKSLQLRMDISYYKRYKVGCVLFDIQELMRRLKTYSQEDIKSCSIESFRNRVMFPLYSSTNKLIGFVGRRIGNNAKYCKYLLSKESSVFSKQRAFYGLKESKEAFKKQDFIVLTEGNYDAFRLIANDIPACSVMGVEISNYQKTVLERMYPKIVICLDNDRAGKEGTNKILSLNWNTKIEVIKIPTFKDVDELISKKGIEIFKSLLEESLSSYEWRLDYILSSINRCSADSFKSGINQIRSLISSLTKEDQSYYYGLSTQWISNALSLSQEEIDNLKLFPFNKQRYNAKRDTRAETSKPRLTTHRKKIDYDLLGVRLLSSFLVNKELLEECFKDEELAPFLFLLEEKMKTVELKSDVQIFNDIKEIKLLTLQFCKKELLSQKVLLVKEERFTELESINNMIDASEHLLSKYFF